MRELPNRILRAARARSASLLLRVAGSALAYLVRAAAQLSDRGAGVVLVYHCVGDPPGDPRRELVPALGSSLFAAQVGHLAAHYRLVGASELLAATRERRRGARFPIAITFDDDLPSHELVAAPILSAAGATATFFVSGASLQAPYRFWWERLQAAADDALDLTTVGLEAPRSPKGIHELGVRIQSMAPDARDQLDRRLAELVGPDPPESGLRAESLRRLAGSGVEIGFHTRRHYLLPGLDEAELNEAMRDGRSELEHAVGHDLRTISYPHGRGDARVAAAARAAGFEAGFTGTPSAITADSDPFLLGRLSPSYKSVGELAFGVAWALFGATLSGSARATAARPSGPENPL